jgi:hypothetical protein
MPDSAGVTRYTSRGTVNLRIQFLNTLGTTFAPAFGYQAASNDGVLVRVMHRSDHNKRRVNDATAVRAGNRRAKLAARHILYGGSAFHMQVRCLPQIETLAQFGSSLLRASRVADGERHG